MAMPWGVVMMPFSGGTLCACGVWVDRQDLRGIFGGHSSPRRPTMVPNSPQPFDEARSAGKLMRPPCEIMDLISPDHRHNRVDPWISYDQVTGQPATNSGIGERTERERRGPRLHWPSGSPVTSPPAADWSPCSSKPDATESVARQWPSPSSRPATQVGPGCHAGACQFGTVAGVTRKRRDAEAGA